MKLHLTPISYVKSNVPKGFDVNAPIQDWNLIPIDEFAHQLTIFSNVLPVVTNNISKGKS